MTGQIPLFKMTIVDPLSWRFSWYDKSKTPCELSPKLGDEMKMGGRPGLCRLLAGIAISILASPVVPHGSAAELHPGDILVDDFNGSKILQFATDGTLRDSFTGPGTQWLGVALAPDGNIITTTRLPMPHGVNIIRPADSVVGSFATPELDVTMWPGKCSVFADGNIAVPDQAAHVYLYSPTGDLVRTIGPPGASYLVASEHAADDTLWLTDLLQRRVFHLTETGTVLNSFPVGFTPVDIAADPTDGTLWVTDQSDAVIHHLSLLGVSLGDIPTFNGKPPAGISVAADGSLYMTTAWSTVVGHVSRGGVLIDSFNSGATEPTFLTVVCAVPEPSSLSLAVTLAVGCLVVGLARGRLGRRPSPNRTC